MQDNNPKTTAKELQKTNFATPKRSKVHKKPSNQTWKYLN